MCGLRTDELDRLFRLVPNLGLVAENGCFIKYPSTNSWTELVDRAQVAAWKQSVKSILQYYLERTPGSEIEDRNCSLIFHFKNAEDFAMAERQASDWTAHINESCEGQRVHATQLDDCVVVESRDWTKDTAASHIFDHMKTDGGSTEPTDFLMVIGDGREDESVFRWANKLQQDGEVRVAATVTLSGRNTEAKSTLTRAVSGMYSLVLTIPFLISCPKKKRRRKKVANGVQASLLLYRNLRAFLRKKGVLITGNTSLTVFRHRPGGLL